jgi:hypothetical protein
MIAEPSGDNLDCISSRDNLKQSICKWSGAYRLSETRFDRIELLFHGFVIGNEIGELSHEQHYPAVEGQVTQEVSEMWRVESPRLYIECAERRAN